jgi:hypothetical protein
MAHRRVAIARVTPPVDEDHLSPREMKEARGRGCFCFALEDRSALKSLLRRLPDVLDALDAADKTLTAAIDRGSERLDDVDRRLLADAHLFRHVLRVQRFSLGEALSVAKDIPESAWDKPDKIPAIWRRFYLTTGDDPEHVVPRTERVYDPKRGERLAEERKFMLRRYAGTPFGETVARNPVYAYEFNWGRRMKKPDGKGARNPAQSTDPAPTTPPGGAGSGGSSGGATGR